jgi:hypothetical protein
MRVIPALDELEHRHARLDLSAEVAAVEPDYSENAGRRIESNGGF